MAAAAAAVAAWVTAAGAASAVAARAAHGTAHAPPGVAAKAEAQQARTAHDRAELRVEQAHEPERAPLPALSAHDRRWHELP